MSAHSHETRAVKILAAQLMASLEDFFALAENPPSFLSSDTLRELVALFKRISAAVKSAEACTEFLNSVSDALPEELAEARRRLQSAERELVDLRAKADELKELNASKVRKEIASMRRYARELRTDPSCPEASAIRDIAAAENGVATAAAASAEVEDLRRHLDLYRNRDEDHSIKIARLEKELAAMKSRAEAAEAMASKGLATAQKDLRLLGDYRQLGSVAELRQANQDMATYSALGTPGQLRRRLALDSVTIQFMSTLLGQAERAIVHYEGLLGPLLLMVFRQTGAFANALAHLQQRREESAPSAPYFDVGAILPTAHAELHRITPEGYTIDGHDALEIGADVIRRADPETPSSVQEERQRLLDQCTRFARNIRRRQRDRDTAAEPDTLLSDLAAFADPAGARVSDVQQRQRTTGRPSTGSSPRPPRVPSPDADPVTTPQRSAGAAATEKTASKRSRATSGDPEAAPKSKKKHNDVVDLTSAETSSSPTRQATRGSNYLSQGTLDALIASWVDWCPGWPETETRARPTNVNQLERFAWKFGWFQGEQVPPVNKNQCRKLMERLGGVLVSADDILAWADSTPWMLLLSLIPDPITFNKRHRAFAPFYAAVMKFYEAAFRALWERTHYLILPPDDAHGRWRDARKGRRSSSTPLLRDHLAELVKFFAEHPEVDLDLLLDPFFIWLPGAASHFFVVQEGETLDQAVARVDLAEPERAFFLLQPERHPSQRVLSRIHHKFWIDTVPRSPSSAGAESASRASAARGHSEYSPKKRRRRIRTLVESDDDDEPQSKPSAAQLAEVSSSKPTSTSSEAAPASPSTTQSPNSAKSSVATASASAPAADAAATADEPAKETPANETVEIAGDASAVGTTSELAPPAGDVVTAESTVTSAATESSAAAVVVESEPAGPVGSAGPSATADEGAAPTAVPPAEI